MKKVFLMAIFVTVSISFCQAQSIKRQAEQQKQQEQYERKQRQRQEQYEREQREYEQKLRESELKEQARVHKAQLSLSDLLLLVKSKDISAAKQILSARGWTHVATKKIKNEYETELQAAEWRFEPQSYNYELYIAFYNNNDNVIEWVINDEKYPNRLQSELTTEGYKVTDTYGTVFRNNEMEVKTGKVFSMHNYKQAEYRKSEFERLAREATEREEKYYKALDNAEAALQAKNYQEAETYYNSALSLKPDKADYVNTQITKVKQAETDDRYEKTVALGDKAFNEKQYDEAKQYYEIALQIKPESKSVINFKMQDINNINRFLIERRTKIYDYAETNSTDYKRVDEMFFAKIKQLLEEEGNMDYQTVTVTISIDTMGNITRTMPPSLKNKTLKHFIEQTELPQATKYGYNVNAKATYSYSFSAEKSSSIFKKNYKNVIKPYNATANSLIKYDYPFGKYKVQLHKYSINGKTFSDNRVLTYKETGGPANVFLSILIPGLGDHRVTYGKRTGLGITIPVYALIGAGVGLKFYSNSEYKKYHAATTQGAMDDHYKKANYSNQAFYGCVIAGGIIWISDIIWVASTGAKNTKAHKAYRQAHLGAYYEPNIRATGLSYTINF